MHEIKVEVNPDTGVFRIVHPRKMGDWTPYTSIAYLKVDDQEFYATGHYYAGTFPVHKVWQLKEVNAE